MAINFPIPTVVGQIYTSGANSWEWTGQAWKGLGTVLPGPTGPPGPSEYIPPPRIPTIELGVRKAIRELGEFDSIMYRIPEIDFYTEFQAYNPKIFLFRKNFNNKRKYKTDPNGIGTAIKTNRNGSFGRPKHIFESRNPNIVKQAAKRFTIFECDTNFTPSWGDSFPEQIQLVNSDFTTAVNVDEWLVDAGVLVPGTGIFVDDSETFETPAISLPAYVDNNSRTKFSIPIKFSSIQDTIEIIVEDANSNEISRYQLFDVLLDTFYIPLFNTGVNNPAFDMSEIKIYLEADGGSFVIEKIGQHPDFQVGNVPDTNMYQWKDMLLLPELIPSDAFTVSNPTYNSGEPSNTQFFDSSKIVCDWYYNPGNIWLSTSGNGSRQFFKFAIGIEYQNKLYYGPKSPETLVCEYKYAELFDDNAPIALNIK